MPENKIIIRRIEKKDEAELARLIRSVFEEYDIPKEGTVYSDPTTDHLSEIFKAANSLLLVAEEKGELLGSCGFFPTEGLPKNCAEVVKLYLSPKARGKKIGSTLYNACESEAKKKGYESLYLECFSAFKEALRLYEQSGYVYLKERMGNSGHFGCPIWMLKRI